MGVNIDPFLEVSSNTLTPDLSKPKTKIDLGSSNEALYSEKPEKGITMTIHDLKRTSKKMKQKESVIKTDLSTRTIEELLDKIRQQQIKQVQRGL